jgi:hypothetical protein
VLLNGFALNVLSLESLGLPRWRLSIGWDRWLELRWLEGLAKKFLPKMGFCQAGVEWFTMLALSFSFLSSSRTTSNLYLSRQ